VIVPSVWYENSPLAIYEAFALAKPVVGSRIGGIPELVEPGVTGELAEPGDPASLAAAVRALSDRADLEEMGRTARRRAEAWFDPETHYGEITGIYRKAGACESQ
jgi:glycosyltransferase involved in cell wall biosynthesis